MWYEALIIWDDGKKEVYETDTYEDAAEICEHFRSVFGNQIQFTGVDRIS